MGICRLVSTQVGGWMIAVTLTLKGPANPDPTLLKQPDLLQAAQHNSIANSPHNSKLTSNFPDSQISGFSNSKTPTDACKATN
jgi:hypothetical protein